MSYLTSAISGQGTSAQASTSSIYYGATTALTINSEKGVSFCNNTGGSLGTTACSISSTGILNCNGLVISGPLTCTSLVVPVGGMICNGTLTCNNGLTITGNIDATNATISCGNLITQIYSSYAGGMTATSTSPSASQIGYTIFGTSSSTANLSSGTTLSVYSVTIPVAGVWIISANCALLVSVAATCSYIIIGLSNTINTLPVAGSGYSYIQLQQSTLYVIPAAGYCSKALSHVVVTTAANTTIYLNAQAGFTPGTINCPSAGLSFIKATRIA